MTAGQRPSNTVLITGCSTGIGKATAERLARAGWNVYATARRAESLDGLAAQGCKTLTLDVDDEPSMQAAVRRIESESGPVGVLVNNAGYSQSGAIESVPLERVRRQFETNVFGLVRLTQLVLPGMRRQRWGKIVNLSSMGGKLVFPGGGFYHATKFAVEAISDALRFEVKAFGINVVVIEPGLIRTQFGDTVAENLEGIGGGDGAYEEFNRAVASATKDVYVKGPLAKLGGGPEAVAAVIQTAIESSRPKPRYAVTASAKLLLAQRRILSDRLWDGFLKSQFPQPGR